MIKGFHIPLSIPAEQIRRLGEELLASGAYGWIEVKYPYDVVGYDPEPYARAVRELVKRHSPAVSLHVPTNYDLGVWSKAIRTATLEQVRRSIDFAAELGATVLAIHPGTIFTMDIPTSGGTAATLALLEAAERLKERARELTVEALRELSGAADRHGLVLALENVLLPQETVYDWEQLVQILDAVARPNVRALLDCGHAHRCGLDSAEFARRLGDRLCHVHVNDNDGTCDLHLQIGEGNIAYRSVFAALRAADYRGAVVVETSWRSVEDLMTSAGLLDALMSSP
jgi:sugar phosphate isomerase/epimerase